MGSSNIDTDNYKYKVCKIHFTRTCPTCGKVFATIRDNRLYCSPKCRPAVLKTCGICGTRFKPSTAHKKYCTYECSEKALALITTRKKQYCVTCGKLIVDATSPRQYCSTECRNAKRYIDIWMRKPRVCAGCGVPILHGRGNYCSNECRKTDKARKKKPINRCLKCGTPIGARWLHYAYCRECQSEMSCKISYCRHCKKVIRINGGVCEECKQKRVTAQKQRRKSVAKEYKNTLKATGCVYCGYNRYPGALEFHHINQEKEINFASCDSVNHIKREIETKEIVILCANCHREVHAGIIHEELLLQHQLSAERQQLNIFNVKYLQ